MSAETHLLIAQRTGRQVEVETRCGLVLARPRTRGVGDPLVDGTVSAWWSRVTCPACRGHH